MYLARLHVSHIYTRKRRAWCTSHTHPYWLASKARAASAATDEKLQEARALISELRDQVDEAKRGEEFEKNAAAEVKTLLGVQFGRESSV